MRSSSVSTTVTMSEMEQRETTRVSVVESISKPLVDFLKTKQNYEYFADYLALCFAVENLLFVQRVVILYHFTQDLKMGGIQIDGVSLKESKTEETDKKEIYLQRVYKLKFEYLEQLHKELDLLLENSVKSTENITFEDVKDCLWLLCKNIYFQFIESNAPNQVNISFDNQRKLQYVLRDNNKDKFESFDDFLYLYHDAMAETWRLMESCYSFNFKSYLRSQKD